MHLRSCVGPLMSDPDEFSVEQLVKALVESCKMYLKCRACCKFINDVCAVLAEHLAQRLQVSGLCENRLKHGIGLDHRGKRRRVDEDFKAALIDEVLVKRKADGKSAVSMADHITESSCREFDRREMQQYLHACWRVFAQPSGVCCLQADGARLDQPARETAMHILQNNAMNVACYLPPQV